MALTRVLPASPLVSDVLIALLLGALVINTPLRHLLGLKLPGAEREPDVYATGLRFTGKWVLRAGIIAMGLKVQTEFFGRGELLLISGVALVALPTTYFVTQALGVVLGVRRALADLLAAGTMICGASAVSAVAPISGAHRDEQGVAIAATFVYSVIALVVFQPIAAAMQLSPALSGIWSGLAVNDLSSAIAVGAQMGGVGGVTAAAAKSARILLLAPTLVAFSFVREDAAPKDINRGLAQHLPGFLLGYVALAITRAVFDRLLPGSATWAALLDADRTLVDLLMSTVSASIGLHLGLRSLLSAGAPALAVGGGASLTMAGLTLGMIALEARGAHAAAALFGVVGLASSYVGFRVATAQDVKERTLKRRFDSGAPLALAEAKRLLDLLERESALDDAALRRVIAQLHPAIGELIPIRNSPLPHGEGCRWVTYWEGKGGWALVAVCREPKSATPIHAHPHRLLGKTIEGVIEELTFEQRGDESFALKARSVLGHDELCETDGLASLHLVHVVGSGTAIDLQLRGPEVGTPGTRLSTSADFDPLALHVGDTFQARLEIDDRPGQGGEGAAAGRPKEEPLAAP